VAEKQLEHGNRGAVLLPARGPQVEVDEGFQPVIDDCFAVNEGYRASEHRRKFRDFGDRSYPVGRVCAQIFPREDPRDEVYGPGEALGR
jgi:hypothetical protein